MCIRNRDLQLDPEPESFFRMSRPDLFSLFVRVRQCFLQKLSNFHTLGNTFWKKLSNFSHVRQCFLQKWSNFTRKSCISLLSFCSLPDLRPDPEYLEGIRLLSPRMLMAGLESGETAATVSLERSSAGSTHS
jgi:hypothetical protein